MTYDPIEAAAASWYSRLRQPNLSDEETVEWQRWMLSDARHAQAFARMDEVSQVLNLIRPPIIAPLNTKRATPRLALKFAMAAAVMLAIGAVTWTVLRSDVETLNTTVAQNRNVQLEEGSQVMLGGNSQIQVKFATHERRIDLERGEASFSVAKDASRPFEVRAGDTRIVAVGTQFNVRRRSDGAVITVMEGRVIVEKTGAPPLSLSAGQQTTTRGSSAGAAMKIEDPSSAVAWQTGRLPFHLEPLKNVVEDVNRYLDRPIMIEDAAIGELPFTGTVMSDNVSGWVTSLERIFGLQAIEAEDRILLKRDPRMGAH